MQQIERERHGTSYKTTVETLFDYVDSIVGVEVLLSTLAASSENLDR